MAAPTFISTERHDRELFARDVREGLLRPGQKQLPSKYLYDEVGSALFEAICLLPEYGLNRAGGRLMRRTADEIVARLPRPIAVAELGSGSGSNTRFLLEALARQQTVQYYPIDISAQALSRCRQELGNLDAVTINELQRNYLEGLAEVSARRHQEESLLVLFLGSTIGNFDRPAGEEFLGRLRNILQLGDALLLATDLEKPVDQIVLAYDDPTGVTAAFDLNLLARINRQLHADFDLTKFRHESRWNAEERRIEMHLCSRTRQRVNIRDAGCEVLFEDSETIWTESSHKYNLAEVAGFGERAGYVCEAQWVDSEWAFAHTLLIGR